MGSFSGLFSGISPLPGINGIDFTWLYALNPDLGCPDLFLRTLFLQSGNVGDCGDCLSVDDVGQLRLG